MSSIKREAQAFLVLLMLFSSLTIVQIGAQSVFELGRIESISISAVNANHFIPEVKVKPREVEADSYEESLDPIQTIGQNRVQLASPADLFITGTATANLLPRTPAATLTVVSTHFLSNSAHVISAADSTDPTSTSVPDPTLTAALPSITVSSSDTDSSLGPNPFLSFVSTSLTEASTITSSASIVGASTPTYPIITDPDSDPNTTNNSPNPSSSDVSAVSTLTSLTNATASTIVPTASAMMTSISTHITYVTASESDSDSASTPISYTSTSTVTVTPSSSSSSSAATATASEIDYNRFAITISLIAIVILAAVIDLI